MRRSLWVARQPYLAQPNSGLIFVDVAPPTEGVACHVHLQKRGAVHGLDNVEHFVGKSLGTSDWTEVDQSRIDQFAE